MEKDSQQLHAMRHSMAHIMATAIKRLWPEAKLGVGPVIQNGFYYDLDAGVNLSTDDFTKIEAEMKKVIAEDQPFEQFDLSVDEAIEWAKNERQPYKSELLNDLKRAGTTSAKDIDAEELGLPAGESKVEKVSFYRNGGFTDLCRGPHVESTGRVGAFKLMKIAGVYWRAKEDNPQLQRITGAGFSTQQELDAYLEAIEEAKKRDHRVLGKQLDLYTMSPLVGAGLPLFTPRGTELREAFGRYSNQLRQALGFKRVWTPHITKQDLYETSGHWAKFGDELFIVTSQETSDSFALKPMNCPHHTQIYVSQPRSYRDMPLRYLETTTDYRDEKTGELGGLNRVRSLTQDDSHVFCRQDQIQNEINNLISCAKELYGSIGMPLRVRLSYRDNSDTYIGEAALWESAQAQLKEAVVHNGLEFFEEEGEAAFYGPKIDFTAADALGREHQVATIQLDFVQPQRFGLSYTDEHGEAQTPVMIHCALLGSIERFMSVLIEHTAGWFPFWSAPEQIRILTINDAVQPYVEEITKVLDELVLMSPLKYNELRYSVDNRQESLGRKIRDAHELKVPVTMIIGPKDAETNVVSIRTRNGEQKMALNDLAEFLRGL